MQQSSVTGVPRIVRCPHCGAPLDAESDQRSARCRYCGHIVKLRETVPRAAPAAPPPRLGSLALPPPLLTALVAAGILVVVGGALIAWASSTAGPLAPPPTPVAQETRYPLRALLGVNVDLDVDASKPQMQRLFPSVEPKLGIGLEYRVPLEHPWFGHAAFTWKNASAGKLLSFQLDHLQADELFKNQRAIADCLTKGLGKPEAVESNHLAGEWSYYWRDPSRGTNVSLSVRDIWMDFEGLVVLRDRLADSPAPPAVSVKQVLATLDSCLPSP